MESKDTKFIERLELIKANDSVRSFAKKCGINEGTMLRYFNGSLPSINNAYMIAKACGVSLTWLAGGEGGEALSEGKSKKSVPVYDMDTSSDNPRFDNKEFYMFSISVNSGFAEVIGGDENNLTGLYMRGKSMEPELNQGDILLVDTTAYAVSQDSIYAFYYKNAHYIKRLQRIGDKVKVLGANNSYDSWMIDNINDIKVFGEAVGKVARL